MTRTWTPMRSRSASRCWRRAIEDLWQAYRRAVRDPGAEWKGSVVIGTAAGPHIEGFDLHARLAIATDQAGGETRLEKLVRYCARPPIANDRLSLSSDGRVLLRLKTPWANGTTHLLYEPLDFLAKLAALIPRPHKNLVLYHGVLAARSKLRARVVAYGRSRDESTCAAVGGAGAPGQQRGAWADLMRRAFGYELLACTKCGGKMMFLSCILRRDVIAHILTRAGPSG